MIDNNPGTEQKLLTQADFNNPEVLNTINPHPTFGYFHGKSKVHTRFGSKRNQIMLY
jgi:hypothetical protein